MGGSPECLPGPGLEKKGSIVKGLNNAYRTLVFGDTRLRNFNKPGGRPVGRGVKAKEGNQKLEIAGVKGERQAGGICGGP